MKVKHPPPSAEEVSADPQQSDVAEALRTLETFTRTQVAWLMSTAMRWGYELRVDEENAAYPPAPIFNARDTERALDQHAYRAQCDQAARVARLGDHPGGPGEIWGADEDDIQVAA